MSQPVISVRSLRFAYARSVDLALDEVDFELDAGARCLLLGANGAGKSTLLRVLAGKHMILESSVRVLGLPAFHDTSLAAHVEYLGGPFGFDVDVRVGNLVERVLGVPRERRQRLLRVLGVDVDWHMHQISDGQRRRVQILLGLLRSTQLLLLDEITTDLDLLARRDLLQLLREESEQAGTTIVYASHILDRLEEWATHLAYMSRGKITRFAPLPDVTELRRKVAEGRSAPLSELVESWLVRDLEASGG